MENKSHEHAPLPPVVLAKEVADVLLNLLFAGEPALSPRPLCPLYETTVASSAECVGEVY